MKQASRKTAFCGMTGALCMTILLCGRVFPFATYAAPAAAACLLMPVCYEYGQKTGFVLYGAVAFLSLFMLPDKEMMFMFVLIFGPYTAAKFSFDRIKNGPLRLGGKLVFFNLALAASYWILLFVFPVNILVEEFYGYSPAFVRLMIILFNIVFLLYDKASEKLLIIYVYKFRRMFFR